MFIFFTDGRPPSTNPVLGKFLDLHPLNGEVFRELNQEKEANDDIEILNIELDAQVMARSMSLEERRKLAEEKRKKMQREPIGD